MSHESRDQRVVARYSEACSVLADPRYLVPEVRAGATSSALDWLRANVSRFCNADDHARRRAIVEADLARIDVGRLQRAAYERALAGLRRELPRALDPRACACRVARTVPVVTLASALDVPENRLHAVCEAVTAVAAAYHPNSSADAEIRLRAGQGVERLLHLVGQGAPERLANRIGLLVQACTATAELILSAFDMALRLPRSCSELWPISAIISETLRYDPPVRSTRRHCLDDEGAASIVLIDLAGANRDPDAFAEPDRFDPGRRDGRHLTFGHGLRPCPGAGHAMALACGVVTALLAHVREADPSA